MAWPRHCATLSIYVKCLLTVGPSLSNFLLLFCCGWALYSVVVVVIVQGSGEEQEEIPQSDSDTVEVIPGSQLLWRIAPRPANSAEVSHMRPTCDWGRVQTGFSCLPKTYLAHCFPMGLTHWLKTDDHPCFVPPFLCVSIVEITWTLDTFMHNLFFVNGSHLSEQALRNQDKVKDSLYRPWRPWY